MVLNVPNISGHWQWKWEWDLLWLKLLIVERSHSPDISRNELIAARTHPSMIPLSLCIFLSLRHSVQELAVRGSCCFCKGPMHFLVFLGPVVAMDTRGCWGCRLRHSPPEEPAGSGKCVPSFDKIKGMKQIPAPQFCGLSFADPRGSAVKARLVLRQPGPFWRAGIAAHDDQEHKNTDVTHHMTMKLDINQGRFRGTLAVILPMAYPLLAFPPRPKSEVFCSPLNPRNHWSNPLIWLKGPLRKRGKVAFRKPQHLNCQSLSHHPGPQTLALGRILEMVRSSLSLQKWRFHIGWL